MPRDIFFVVLAFGLAIAGGSATRSASLPAGPAAPGPGAGGRACPRCGERDPRDSLRNKPGLVVFLIAFVGIWAVGLYWLFFV